MYDYTQMSSNMQWNISMNSEVMVQTSESRLKPCKNEFHIFLPLYLKKINCSIHLLEEGGGGGGIYNF